MIVPARAGCHCWLVQQCYVREYLAAKPHYRVTARTKRQNLVSEKRIPAPLNNVRQPLGKRM
jgi:hypothetical protein